VSDNDPYKRIKKKNLEKIGLLLRTERKVKESINNNVSTPPTNLAQPILRNSFVHLIKVEKLGFIYALF
jgi:hypothetical protein